MVLTLDSIDTVQRRKMSVGLWGFGGFILGVSVPLNTGLLGVIIFAICALSAMFIVHNTSDVVYDERDQQLHQQASGLTLTIFGYASATIFPSLTALHASGVYDWPVWMTPIALLIAVLYVSYASITAYLQWSNK